MRLKQSSFVFVAVLALCALASCGRPAAKASNAAAKTAADADYQAPPTVTSVRTVAGQVEVFGTSRPQAAIRMAKPTGPAGQAAADKTGHWVLRLPSSNQNELYGVSESIDGRQLQASGYLLVTPGGLGVVLRSGAGALVLSDPEPARISAFDIDREGGAVVSGFGPAGTRISARVDGDKLGDGRIDAQGRYVLALSGPVNPGRHSLKVFGEAIDASLTVETDRAPVLTSPFRTVQVGPHLRVDWMTPGGGEQTTWIYGQEKPIQ